MPLARLSTTDGTITVRLRKDIAPKTVANFLSYANSGRYDDIFWTRSDVNQNNEPFVIQGGSLQVTGAGTAASDVKATTQDAMLADENPGGISNTIGTLAFAKGGANTATNQFFINLNDNSFLDPASNGGGFTVFAQVTTGLSAAQATQQHQKADLTSQIGTVASSSNTGVTDVPVQDATQAQTLNPRRDLIIVRRIAVVDKILPVV
jgi:cyclophilin family peptidyl-prolyl cis-trans isomerase